MPRSIARRTMILSGALAPLLPLPAGAQVTPYGIFAGRISFAGGPPVPVFRYLNFPMGGVATVTPDGQPIIVVEAAIGQPFLHFVLAHEYAHHALGHLTAGIIAQMQGGPIAGCFFTHQRELEADAWATWRMRELGDIAAVQAAFQVNSWQGFFAASCYPPGVVRAENIRRAWQS